MFRAEARLTEAGGETVRSGATSEVIISDYTDGVMTSSLVMESVTETELGEYVCSAANIHGEVSLSHHLLDHFRNSLHD